MLPGNEEIGSRLRAAVQAHVDGRLTEAETLYRDVLSLIPNQFDALHNLGVLKLEQRDHASALDLLKRSLAVNPRAASAHLNIGSALRDLKRPAEAIENYDRALAIRPDYPQAHNNRGVALRDLGRLPEAVDSYAKAIAGNPRYVEAMGNCATALLELRRPDDALIAAERALAIRPGYLEAHLSRGHALYALKRYEEAAMSYRAALDNGGNAVEIGYYLAAMGLAPMPRTSPQSYVENLFDAYASRFDDNLHQLGYHVPEMLLKAVTALPVLGTPDIVDLGCGTGLCGPLFRPIARSLTGVDIAEKMLAKARERGVYDRLAKADLTTFLCDRRQSFDLAIAADVFIYVGDLDAVFAAVRGTLRPRGHFAFSAETSDDEEIAIRPSRRYAHSPAYVRMLAARHGFIEQAIIPVAVRREEGQNVRGFIAVLRTDDRAETVPLTGSSRDDGT